MKSASYLNTISHHAYCIVGGSNNRESLKSELETKHKINISGNPDFIERTYQTFTIDDARHIKALADSKPVNATGRKIFILEMAAITSEAQNALLKLLEEPGESTHFFLIIPSAHLLLPTVKSRLSFLGSSGANAGRAEHDEEVLKMARDFIKAAKKDRFEMVKDLADDISKEKKTKSDAIGFVNAVESLLYEGGVKKNMEALESIILIRTYINDRAPSMKMLLDYMGSVI